MAKAIQTKYLGPTDSKGSRIKASAEGMKSLSLPYHASMSMAENHQRAAIRLALLNGLSAELVGGDLPDGSMAWVEI